MKIIRMVCGALLTMALAACGGGGGSAGAPMGSSVSGYVDPNAVSTSGSMTVAVIDSAGASVTKVTFGGQILQATYLNTAGAPIKGARIAFTVTAGTGVVLGGDSALTNDAGVATLTVRSAGSSVAGVATVSAAADGVTSSVNFVLSPEGSDVLSLSLVTASGASTSNVNYGGGQRIRAVYTNASGAPQAGRVVNFAITYGSGAVLGSGSALTDAAGVAFIGVDATDAKVSGAVTVTASNATATGVLNFRILGGGSSTLSLFLVDAAGNPTTSTGYQTGQRIRALYRDETGNPIASATVSFSVSKGVDGAKLAVSSALTDANGVAYVGISSTGPTAAGAATVSATAGSSSSSIDFAVTAEGSPTLTLVLENSASGTVPTVSYGGGQRIRAQYLSAAGTPIVNALVKFSTGTSTDFTVVSAAITDSRGFAYADVAPVSATTVGGVTVQAYVGTVVGMLNVSVKTKAAGLNKLTLAVVDKNRVALASPAISYNGGQLIRAVYIDSDGNPVANTTVNFVVTKGAAGITLQMGSGLTDADGTVYVAINPVDPTVSGAATVSATAGNAGSAIDFAVNAQGSPTLALTLENSANAIVPTVSFGGGQRIKALYRAADGSPIAGAVVKFSSSSATDLLIVSSALTNDKGEAFIDVSPANASTSAAVTVTGWVSNVVSILNVSIRTPVQVPNVLALELSDVNGVQKSSALKFGANQLLRFSYKKGDGSPIAGVRVTFAITAGPTLAFLQADSALTGADGVATVGINSSSAVAVGAATASATVTVGTTALSTNLDFAVTPAAVILEAFTLGSQKLSAGASTSVSVRAKAGAVAVSSVPISLSADCGTLTPVIALTNGSGQATSTYKAQNTDGSNCIGSVKLTATASGSTLDAPALSVDAPVASAVNFVSASSYAIYVQGSGASTQATLKFKVLDAAGAIFPNASVTAAISINPGGIGLGAAGATAPLTLSSDSSGLVSFQIYAGTVPGPVQVKVSLSDLAYAYSSNITVQSGPPAQDRFSLSAASYNIEGQDIDGATTTLTIRVADRQGNAVPDGTVINFTSGGGQIQPSCATTRVNGIASCSVTFSSQQPRPAAQYGRVPILAFAEGVKTYADNNRNNIFDAGDTLSDMGDAYRDDNENQAYDPGEFVLPRGGTQTCASVGSWATPSRAGTCDSQTAATTVRSQIALIMASSKAELTALTQSSGTLTFRANSVTLCPDGSKCLPLANGTTLSATTSKVADCTAAVPVPAVVGSVAPNADRNAQLGTVHSVLLTAADGKTCTGKTVSVTATSPSGAVTMANFTIP